MFTTYWIPKEINNLAHVLVKWTSDNNGKGFILMYALAQFFLLLYVMNFKLLIKKII